MDYLIEPRDERTQSPGVVPGYWHTAKRWPSQPLQRRPLTLSELTGPQGVAQRLAPSGADLAGQGAKRAIGQHIQLRMRVVDEDGSPLPGTLIEVWHANAAGRYIHPNDTDHAPVDPNFYGATRLVTDETGLIELRTVKPGAYPVRDAGHWWRPPHVHMGIWGRVWLSRLATQIFFPGEPLNEFDLILNATPDPEARRRCIARLRPASEGPENALVYEHQIVVRGRRATPQMP